MTNRQLWVSPNGKYRIIDVQKIRKSSRTRYLDPEYIVCAIVQSGTADYWNVYLKMHGGVANPGKLPKYVVDKTRSLMLAKLKSTAKKR